MKYILFLIFGVQCIYLTAQMDTTSLKWDEDTYTTRPKIGLALSGGAAHGLAHIGLLKYLEEVGIHIDYITGTSMGAIIGAMYAIGYDADQCIDIVSNIDWNDVLSSNINIRDISPVEKYSHNKYPLTLILKGSKLVIPAGIINSNKLELLLEELFAPAYQKDNFEKFPIPFRCYSVNIVDGSVVELSNGRISQAVRASMAIPSVFSPVVIDGELLVDGGLVRNFPVSDNFAFGSDIVIGSYVGSNRGKASELVSLLDILKQSAFMMSISDSEHQKSLTDILVVPDVKKEATFGFNNHKRLIALGYEAAKIQKGKFDRLKNLLDQYDRPPPKPRLSDPGFIFINKVTLEDLHPSSARVMREKLDINERSFTTFTNINKGIKAVYATKNFDRIKYQLTPSTDGINLILQAQEAKSTQLGVNINHFSSTNSALILSMQARNHFGRLSNIDLKIRLSENLGIMSRYYKRINLFGDELILGISARTEKSDMPFYNKGKRIKDMFLWNRELMPFAMWEFNNSTSLTLNWKAEHFGLRNSIIPRNDIRQFNMNQYSVGLVFSYDGLNKKYFTTEGYIIKAQFKYTYSNNSDLEVAGELDLSKIPIPDSYLKPRLTIETYTPITKSWTIVGVIDGAYQKRGTLIDNMAIGGSYQDRHDRLPFIGMDESQLHLSTYGYGKLGIRRRLLDQVYISFVANAIAGIIPISGYLDEESSTDFISRYGLGVSIGIDLPIGPIYLDMGYLSKEEALGIYFGLGYRHIY